MQCRNVLCPAQFVDTAHWNWPCTLTESQYVCCYVRYFPLVVHLISSFLFSVIISCLSYHSTVKVLSALSSGVKLLTTTIMMIVVNFIFYAISYFFAYAYQREYALLHLQYLEN